MNCIHACRQIPGGSGICPSAVSCWPKTASILADHGTAVANLREIHHLAPEQQQQLMQESCAVAALMEQALSPDKINIGALGNLVPQLHLHHVARFAADRAWPGPIWGLIRSCLMSHKFWRSRPIYGVPGSPS